MFGSNIAPGYLHTSARIPEVNTFEEMTSFSSFSVNYPASLIFILLSKMSTTNLLSVAMATNRVFFFRRKKQ
jgi:hypothetical protein